MKRIILNMAAMLLSAFPVLSTLNAQPTQLTLDDFLPHGGNWETVGSVAISEIDRQQLNAEPGDGMIYNGAIGKTTNILTRQQYKDLEVHVEFMVPENSNSGVYLQGRYEIQVRDSWGKDDVRFGDVGAIYQRWKPSDDPYGFGWQGMPPRVNAAKAPGEWQTLDIIFRAPRFDKEGNKIEDATFVQVVLNGTVVQQNQPVTGPTRAAHFEDEQPTGPLMLQGDHGPVAYRNIRVRELDLDTRNLMLNTWHKLDLKNDFDVVIEDMPDTDPDDVLKVVGDEIHCLQNWPDGKAAPSGMLVSKKRFGWYDLELEIKHSGKQFPPGLDAPPNAGLLYHIQATTPIWPPCLEMQGRITQRGNHFSIRGPNGQHVQADGTIVDIPENEFAYAGRWSNPEVPGWNKMRVEVRGDRARYFVNDIQVNEIRNATFGGLPCTAGFVGFQSEYAEVKYRNLRIRLLQPY